VNISREEIYGARNKRRAAQQLKLGVLKGARGMFARVSPPALLFRQEISALLSIPAERIDPCSPCLLSLSLLAACLIISSLPFTICLIKSCLLLPCPTHDAFGDRGFQRAVQKNQKMKTRLHWIFILSLIANCLRASGISGKTILLS
jgi:hypothetical protein